MTDSVKEFIYEVPLNGDGFWGLVWAVLRRISQ